MGFTERERDEAVLGGILELARALGVHVTDATPCLAQCGRFAAEFEAGHRMEREADAAAVATRERDARVQNESAKAQYERDVERLITQHATRPTPESDWALRQAGVSPSHIPGHAQCLVPR